MFQLAYQYAFSQIICHWLVMPPLFYLTIVGPLNVWPSRLLLFIYPLRFVFHTLGGIEYMVNKYITIVITKRVLPIVDDFFATYFFVANMGIGFILTIVYNFTQDAYEVEAALGGWPKYIAMKSPIGKE